MARDLRPSFIQSFAPSGSLLYPGTCFIRIRASSGLRASSGSVLHPSPYSIRVRAASGSVLYPGLCSIRIRAPSRFVLHPGFLLHPGSCSIRVCAPSGFHLEILTFSLSGARPRNVLFGLFFSPFSRQSDIFQI